MTNSENVLQPFLPQKPDLSRMYSPSIIDNKNY